MDRPILRQGSDAPIVRGRGTIDLCCKGCGKVLAERLEPDSLLAVDLECHGCGEITRSPEWSRAEPLPMTLVNLGSSGRFLSEGTLSASSDVAITCEQEIRRVRELFGSRPVVDSEIALSSETLKAVLGQFDAFTNSMLSRELGKTRVASLHGNLDHNKTKVPLAWAINRLERQLQAGKLHLSADDGVAIGFMASAQHFVQRWSHHPMFSDLARALVYEFHHAVTMLITASYLEDSGNRIGFMKAPGDGESSPDLFVNLSHSKQLPIEVKAPGILQWPSNVTDEKARSTIETHLKKVKRQLVGVSGVVVIGISAESGRERAEAALQSLVKKGTSSKISAVVSVVRDPSLFYRAEGTRTMMHASQARITPVANARFQGDMRVKF